MLRKASGSIISTLLVIGVSRGLWLYFGSSHPEIETIGSAFINTVADLTFRWVTDGVPWLWNQLQHILHQMPALPGLPGK